MGVLVVCMALSKDREESKMARVHGEEGRLMWALWGDASVEMGQVSGFAVNPCNKKATSKVSSTNLR